MSGRGNSRGRKQTGGGLRLGGGEWGVTANRYGASFWGDEKVLKLDCGDGYTTL